MRRYKRSYNVLTLLVFFNMSGKKKTNFKASSLQILSLLYRPFIVLHTRWSDGGIQLLYVRVNPRRLTVTGNRATVHDLVNYHEELEFEYLRLTPLCDWSGSLFRDLTCSYTSERSHLFRARPQGNIIKVWKKNLRPSNILVTVKTLFFFQWTEGLHFIIEKETA